MSSENKIFNDHEAETLVRISKYLTVFNHCVVVLMQSNHISKDNSDVYNDKKC